MQYIVLFTYSSLIQVICVFIILIREIVSVTIPVNGVCVLLQDKRLLGVQRALWTRDKV